jgi:hypothetical protein
VIETGARGRFVRPHPRLPGLLTPRRLAALATLGAVLAVTVAVGGLGLGREDRLSKPEYERTLQAAYADVQRAFRETNVTEPSELAVRVGLAQEQLRKAADTLASREVPATVAAQNEQIVAGLRAYADDLDVLRVAAVRGDRGAIENFTAAIGTNTAIAQIATAARQMELEGYEVGAISGE